MRIACRVVPTVLFGLALATSLGLLPGSNQAEAAQSLQHLIDGLKSSTAAERIEAARALADLGHSAATAVPALIKALEDEDDEVRAQAARALGAIGPEAATAVDALTAQLDHSEARVRGYAVRALGQIGEASRKTVPKLVELLTDADARVRRVAVDALARIHPDPEQSIPLLVKVLHDADPQVVMPAIQALAERGKAAVPVLIEALGRDDSRYWACLILSEIGPDAAQSVPALRSVLDDEDPEVRMEAIVALGQIGPAARAAVPALQQKLASDIPGVRYTAVFALAEIGDPSSVRPLEQSQSSDDPLLSALSAWALARLQPENQARLKKAVDLLVPALASDDDSTQALAARALGELQAPREMVAPLLATTLEKATPETQARMIDAMAGLGPLAATRAAAALSDERLRVFAARLLQRIGADAKEAVPALTKAISSDSIEHEFRTEVHFALGSIGPAAKEAVPALIKALEHADEDVRFSACYALGQIGPDAHEAAAALRQNLAREDAQLQMVSAWALVRIEGASEELSHQVLPVLVKGLSHERAVIRSEAARMLGEFGSAAQSAAASLETALRDSDAEVRRAAADALGRVRG